MESTVIYQSVIDSTITVNNLDEARLLALANPGDEKYLSWIEVIKFTV